MRQVPSCLLAALVTLGPNHASAQTEKNVYVRISGDACLIGNLAVPCSGVGAELRKLGTPLNKVIQLSSVSHGSYRAISAAMDSILRAGFKVKKVGRANVGP